MMDHAVELSDVGYRAGGFQHRRTAVTGTTRLHLRLPGPQRFGQDDDDQVVPGDAESNDGNDKRSG